MRPIDAGPTWSVVRFMPVAAELRRSGFKYSSRTRLIQCDGGRHCTFPFAYLGADDQAGANYTKQPAVDSYYEHVCL